MTASEDRGPGMPEISVIVPHLDAPEGLVRLFESLDAQKGAPPFEVIVCDNGSTRPPDPALFDQPDRRLLHEPRHGPGPARNTGAAAARGTILAFTDADCIADPDWLAALHTHLAPGRDTTPPVVAGEVRIAFADPDRPTAIEAYEAIYGYRQALYVARDGYGATCNLGMRADVFAAVGPFAGLERAEDRDWGRRASAMGHAHVHAPEAVIRTPARASFAELARKWDRHMGHDRAEAAPLRWGLRAAAVAVSPLAEIARVATSDRIAGSRARALAFAVVCRIRLYRAARMIALLPPARATAASRRWRDG